MLHNAPLITTLAVALALALVLGFLTTQAKLPALVGYLLAGVLIGPFTPGFVGNTDITSQLAEVGVMLLMFGVGLHFSLEDLREVRKIALPGALMQIGVASGLGAAIALSWGWGIGGAIVFGLSLSVASTVVLLRALEARGALESVNGQIAVGWLIVEDLAMVLVLVLLPPLAGPLGGNTGSEGVTDLWQTLAITLGKVSVFIALMLAVGRRVFPWLLWQVTRTGSRELFTLCIVAAAVSIAYGASTLFGVSFSLGAFFAGMVLRESEFSQRAAEESLPLRDAFAVLFFVSVGMLFDPAILLEQPLRVLAVVAIIVLGKSLAAMVLVLSFRYPLNTALTVSASLAQIGEFSFILAGLGRELGLLPAEGQSLILGGALISIAMNSLVFKAVEPLQVWIRGRSKLARVFERCDDPLVELPHSTRQEYLSQQVVLVGYGRVGRRIGDALTAQGIPFVVAEQNRELVEKLRKGGIPAVSGDASDPAVLIQAHIARAQMLVIATPDTFNVRQMASTARTLNPKIVTIVRTHNEDEADLLRLEKIGKIFLGENELATNMTQHVVERYSRPTGQATSAGTEDKADPAFHEGWNWGAVALVTLVVSGAVGFALVRNGAESEPPLVAAGFDAPALPVLGTEEPRSPSIPVAVATPATVVPKSPLEPIPTTYTIRPGDTLTRIAQKRYGSPKHWRLIASANPALNPDRLAVGRVITLPEPPKKEGRAGLTGP